MLHEWVTKSRWSTPDKIAGLYLFQKSDETYYAEVTILKKSRKNISVVKTQWIVGSLSDVLSIVPEQMVICLTVDGKGVIINELLNENEFISANQIIPGGKDSDFYLKQIAVEMHKTIVAMTRKESVDHIIELLKQKKCWLFDLCVGPLAINYIGALIQSFPQPFSVPFRNIIWQNQQISSVSTNNITVVDTNYSIGNEIVSAMSIQSFAHAFTGLAFPGQVVPISESITNNRREILFRQAYKVLAAFTLVFFFTILLVNYLFFDYYDKKLTKNQLSYSHSQVLITQVEKKNKELQLRKKMAQKTGMTEKKHYSYFADIIAASLPSYISFSELTINPVQKSKNNRGSLLILNRQIIIKGKITRSSDLNKWLINLNNFNWIRSVEIDELKQETQYQPAFFTITIQLNQ